MARSLWVLIAAAGKPTLLARTLASLAAADKPGSYRGTLVVENGPRCGIEDVVFVTLNFNQRSMAHIHVSWLDPHKIRKVTIVGNKRMVVFDDLESTEKLKIYDKSAQHTTDYNTFAEYITLRFGDITIPHVKVDEPLQLECQHFLDCVRERRRPLTDGRDGLRVVKVLDAAGSGSRISRLSPRR